MAAAVLPIVNAELAFEDEEEYQRLAAEAKRDETRRRRWRHRAVHAPLNGLGLHHLMALSDRDWRRWPRGGAREGLDNSGVMVFTAEDFDSDCAFDGEDAATETTEAVEGGSSIYYGSTTTSSSDSEDGESEDWEDPLWVKDENVRTEGRSGWTSPRAREKRNKTARSKKPRKELHSPKKAKSDTKKNESEAKTTEKENEDDGMDETEQLMSSREMSWIIDTRLVRSRGEAVIVELEEQDVEEEDRRTRARAGTESGERGAEYLLQKYFQSMPTFPTRHGAEGRMSVTQQVIAQAADAAALATDKQGDQAEKSDKLVVIPRIEGLAEPQGEVKRKATRRGRKHSTKKPTVATPEPLPATPRLAPAPTTTTTATTTTMTEPKDEASLKGAKGPRSHLVNLFNLSPRRPRDLSKRRSSFIRRRSIEEEEEAAAQEAALRHLEQQIQAVADEVGYATTETESESEFSTEEDASSKPRRRKRSISIPLSSFRRELELSLKSSLSKSKEESKGAESGSNSKKSSLARRLRRKGGQGHEHQHQPHDGGAKAPRQGKNRFNTITSMVDMRRFYADIDEGEEPTCK